jgi:hypothetical protein
MRLTGHVTLNLKNMSTAAVFLDIEKAYFKTWHTGFQYTFSELEFSASFSSLALFFLRGNSMFRWKVYPKDNASRGVTRYRPVPYTV